MWFKWTVLGSNNVLSCYCTLQSIPIYPPGSFLGRVRGEAEHAKDTSFWSKWECRFWSKCLPTTTRSSSPLLLLSPPSPGRPTFTTSLFLILTPSPFRLNPPFPLKSTFSYLLPCSHPLLIHTYWVPLWWKGIFHFPDAIFYISIQTHWHGHW